MFFFTVQAAWYRKIVAAVGRKYNMLFFVIKKETPYSICLITYLI
ncbi:MAG: PD-(D/E)XK nuclease-like domain-containing protein [Prevotellaceae bacterium]|nr:PD-(D/E)XK nuclease-like domain-containing protein [Prevotellaceae bacterium]